MKKMMRAVLAALLTLALCAQGLPSACAAGVEECSLTIVFVTPEGDPVPGAAFKLWRVGEKTAEGDWVPLEHIVGYNVLHGPGNLGDKAITLLGYLLQDKVAPDGEAQTDEKGTVKFSSLAHGLYLVAGERHILGGKYYTPTPVLLTVPDHSSGETQVTAKVKYDSGQPEPKLDRHVLKTWNDAGHKEERPKSVTVRLLCDGEVYDTVTLTAEGSWRYDWTNLDGGKRWMVVEEVNANYTVVVEQKGITFQITNTWQDDPPGPDDPPPTIDIPDDPPPLVDPPGDPSVPEEPIPDDGPPLHDPPDFPTDPPSDDVELPDDPVPEDGGPTLPQTGQLWWPVAPMALAGLVLMALGWKRRRDWSGSDET